MLSARVVMAVGMAVVASALGAGGAMSSVTASAPPATDAPATEAVDDASTIAEDTATDQGLPGSPWTSIGPGPECVCADGAQFSFFVRDADPAKVVFFLEGGGACFTAESCAFTDADSTLYDWNIGPDDDPSLMNGIFALDNPENPFADYSFVYVPYCTGDVHFGDITREYSPDLTVEHNGWVNGGAAVAYLAEHYPDAEQVVVVGESAGSIAAAVYSGLIGDELAGSQITVFADGSGGYPDNPSLNAGMAGLWGVVHPEWAADVPPEEWSIPGMVEFTGTHNPDIVMSRFDYAYDGVQVAFMSALGLEDPLLATIDTNEARIEAAGVDQSSFTAPGSSHTLVRKDAFYEMELEGVRLVDWVTSIVNGEAAEDVHCTECETP